MMKIKITLFFALYIFYLSANSKTYGEPWIVASQTDILNMVEEFLPDKPIILEAGVCDATDTIAMKKKWAEATIYGFEPNPETFKLAVNITKNLKGIKIYKIALFDRIGKISFFRSRVNRGASSLLKDNLSDPNVENTFPSYQDEKLKVQCTTINQWAKENKIRKIDYIWLDTEGAELQILKNATDILPNVGVISTEINFQEYRCNMTQFEELNNFLESQNFHLKYIWGSPETQADAIYINNNLLN